MPLVIKSAAKKNILGENYENEEFFIICRGIGAMFREKLKCQIGDKFTLQALHDTVCIG